MIEIRVRGSEMHDAWYTSIDNDDNEDENNDDDDDFIIFPLHKIVNELWYRYNEEPSYISVWCFVF